MKTGSLPKYNTQSHVQPYHGKLWQSRLIPSIESLTFLFLHVSTAFPLLQALGAEPVQASFACAELYVDTDCACACILYVCLHTFAYSQACSTHSNIQWSWRPQQSAADTCR